MNVPVKPNGSMMKFSYGDELISFERQQRLQATGKVLIKVLPDCQVIALAPEQASDEEVLVAVKKRSRWIYEQLRDFRKQLELATPRQYISGESHYYLGKQYQLKVLESSTQKQSVKLLRGKLEVSVKAKSSNKVKELLDEWYKERAKDTFNKRLDAILDQALWVNERPPILILTMQTQWGSCSPNGRLTLNPHLVKAPRECIDYVILHELCHIAEHNHSERFYRLMSKVMPNWEKTKAHLDGMASKII
jgi:predicted metal-dependent hydrolase